GKHGDLGAVTGEQPGRRHPDHPAQSRRGHRGRPHRRAGDQRPARPHRGATVTALREPRRPEEGAQETGNLLARVSAWHAQDPDAETREELERLITDARAGDYAAVTELRDRFDSRLAFGTAGLRRRIAAGPNRMNRVLV